MHDACARFRATDPAVTGNEVDLENHKRTRERVTAFLAVSETKCFYPEEI
jgi:hypothetical protein